MVKRSKSYSNPQCIKLLITLSSCKITLKTKSCSITGTGSLKMIATGFLWFEYEDRTWEDGAEDEKHYKWGLVMENSLPNDDDRSTVVEFKVGFAGSSTVIHYCTDPCISM